MKKYLVVFGLLIFFAVYATFWTWYFAPVSKNQITQFVTPLSDVLAATVKKEETPSLPIEPTLVPTAFSLPKSHSNLVVSRKQVFNLSCEFGAAATILHHFTKKEEFAPVNEEKAERSLMSMIGVSQNPNIGIRMGDVVSAEDPMLYENLQKVFGGTEYYGVHAPPFVELFKKYNLVANPINKSENTILAIKHALYGGGLVMAWIHVGQGLPVDVALEYGSTSVFKGEHSLVIYGYNEEGFLVMDPGNGAFRKIKYKNMIDAAQLFPMPFLEIYPAASAEDFSSYDLLTVPVDSISGLDRRVLNVGVENGSDVIGKGSEMANILRDYGYKVVAVRTREHNELEGIIVRVKDKYEDYISLIKRDFKMAFYSGVKVIKDIPDTSSEDIIVIIGI